MAMDAPGAIDGASRPGEATSGARTHAPGRIPVVLVTGFLGSGKTTLVNRMLRERAYARAAVVVNEYGQIGVDHLLVDVPPRRMRLIDGGCLCGHVHEEVATRLLDLLAARHLHGDASFDRVLIETSGLADPVPIVQILQTDPAVSAAFDLHAVVTVCDAVHGETHLDRHEVSLKQAAVADVIVVSKVDVAAAGMADALTARLARINPGARRVAAAFAAFDLAIVDATGHAPGARTSEARAWLNDATYAGSTPSAVDDPHLRTFSLTHEGPVTVPGLVVWMNLLAGFRGAGLLRVKGIVNVEGRPFAVQAVQTIVSEPVALGEWPADHDRRSRLVFITRGIAPEEIRRTFPAFTLDAGRESRNLVIRPAAYARFKATMEHFREGARRSPKAPLRRTAREGGASSASGHDPGPTGA
jgi:G3E family GTPase